MEMKTAEFNLVITWSKTHFGVIAGSAETKSISVRKSERNEKYGLFLQDLQKCRICNILLWMFTVSFAGLLT